MDYKRKHVVFSCISDFVRSPSLRHLRDPRSIEKLVDEILAALGNTSGVWTKWTSEREELARSAWPCWIPEDDLRQFLNSLPGPLLTPTDVSQRLRSFWEESHFEFPDNNKKDSCLLIYNREKEVGTELPAIIGALREFVEQEEERQKIDREAAYRRRREEERLELRQRFLAGADCAWTELDEPKVFYRRINGRAYRIEPSKDKRVLLYRIQCPADAGALLGKYQGRGEANKALKAIAYADEPRW